MTTGACTFSAVGGPLYHSFENITAQPGCCITDGTNTVTSAYGLNNTCHVLYYMGSASPYRLTKLESSTGNLSLSTGQCIALVMNIQNNGQFSTGNGTGPTDAGLASTYGYDGCVVGASTNPNEASSKKTSAANTTRNARHVLLLAAALLFAALPFLMF